MLDSTLRLMHYVGCALGVGLAGFAPPLAGAVLYCLTLLITEP